MVLPLAVGTLLAAGTGTAVAGPGTGPTAVVSMGDSYISGEGGRWKGNSLTNSANRTGTDRAWVSGSSYDPAKVYGTTAAWAVTAPTPPRSRAPTRSPTSR